MGRANPPGEPEIQIHPGYIISENALWAQRSLCETRSFLANFALFARGMLWPGCPTSRLAGGRVPSRPFWTEFCMGFRETLGFSHGCDGPETDHARA